MRVAVKKIGGVESVGVSLSKGLVTIALAPGNHLTMPELRRVIAANGFTPKDATVVVDGVLENRAGTPTVRSNVTNETFVLMPDSAAASAFDDVKRQMSDGVNVEISGRVEPAKGQDQLAVASVKRLP